MNDACIQSQRDISSGALVRRWLILNVRLCTLLCCLSSAVRIYGMVLLFSCEI
jgi:hypothetical protein